MAGTHDLWAREEGFWLNGPQFFRDHMVPHAQMIFPEPAGILTGEDILAGLENMPRWASVRFEDACEAQAGETVVLAYRAVGRREGEEPYRALCSSTYARNGSGWKLLSHQQTPLTSP